MRGAVTASAGRGPGERPGLRAPPASLPPLSEPGTPSSVEVQDGCVREKGGAGLRGRARTDAEPGAPYPVRPQLVVGGLRPASGQRCGRCSVVVQPQGQESAPGRPETLPLGGARSASLGLAPEDAPRRPEGGPEAVGWRRARLLMALRKGSPGSSSTMLCFQSCRRDSRLV